MEVTTLPPYWPTYPSPSSWCEFPCGYYGTICCGSPAACYTDINNEAGCSSILTDVATSTQPIQTFTYQSVIYSGGTISTPTSIPCSDPAWWPSPENWAKENVDGQLRKLKDRWGQGTSFVDYIAQLAGQGGQHCGIGYDSSCIVPDCNGTFPSDCSCLPITKY
jgi:hypothetical protein